MASLFLDGFDYLTAANNNLKWDNASNGGVVTGVYGKGKALQQPNQTKTLASNPVTGFLGFHYQPTQAFVNNGIIVQWKDANTQQVELRVDGSGGAFFTRNGTTIGSVASAANRFVLQAWYWIEAKVVISTTVGVAELKINGNFIINSGVTNLNTQNSANAYFNQVSIAGGSSNVTFFDSFHCWDDAAGDLTTYIGEHEIDTKLPNAVGSNTTWTKGGSTINTNNYQQVNEANEDADTTYVASATANQIDSYGFANLVETTGTIATVAVNTIDRDDDATPRTFDHYVKSGASTALSAAFTPGASYINHQSFFGTNPAGGAAWTIAARNAAEFGYKEIS